ncbi:MAG: citrate transporter [Clostridia bacterium]|nr:citrate transporter [Clostridia bacterium]
MHAKHTPRHRAHHAKLHFREILREHVLPFIKKNAVLLIAVLAAAITAIIVPPDATYLDYFDWKTLTCLFCVLAVVCALKNIRFFFFLAQKIVKIFKNTRASVLALAYITFIGSMLIANDMALLTFLPLGYFVLSSTGKKKYMAFTFIMQNIAANLGGMLTPFGNPQNLYLYTKFHIPTGEFMWTMLPPFVLSVALITLCCFIFVKKESLEITEEKIVLPAWRTIIYGVLFALSIVIVFRVIPFWIGLIVIPVALIFLDRKALAQVDYGLLLTFVAFFIFSGNMSRISVIEKAFGYLMNKNALLVSTLSCQAISNVPSAILLSQFTESWKPLLLGVNIGGVGTLISSLASLITFREYLSHEKGGAKKYLLLFSAFNFAFLLILLGACTLFLLFL